MNNKLSHNVYFAKNLNYFHILKLIGCSFLLAAFLAGLMAAVLLGGVAFSAI
jgi:hypothetical protein|tara:strand:- start:1299 stop:1454 length:156 start_codon:yes stop_codon:yes gene_type:complete